jgi:hypothetical protein
MTLAGAAPSDCVNPLEFASDGVPVEDGEHGCLRCPREGRRAQRSGCSDAPPTGRY